jgi:radical SAM modification target selenobiotic family peptide
MQCIDPTIEKNFFIERRKNMESKELKKLLAGLGIISLITAGSTLPGCAASTGSG